MRRRIEKLIVEDLTRYGIEADSGEIRSLRREVEKKYSEFSQKAFEAVYAFVNSVASFAIAKSSADLTAAHLATSVLNISRLPEGDIKTALETAVRKSFGYEIGTAVLNMAENGANERELEEFLKGNGPKDPGVGAPAPKKRAPSFSDPSV